MTQSELNTFIDLFDTAITSDTPAVKKALRNLLLVASIDSVQTHSPFRDALTAHSAVTSKLQRDIEKIYDKLDLLEIGKIKTTDIGITYGSQIAHSLVGSTGTGPAETNAYITTTIA